MVGIKLLLDGHIGVALALYTKYIKPFTSSPVDSILRKLDRKEITFFKYIKTRSFLKQQKLSIFSPFLFYQRRQTVPETTSRGKDSVGIRLYITITQS